MTVFDITFDYKTDHPAPTKPDPDRDSPRLKADHQLLWTKALHDGELFKPQVPALASERRKNYLAVELDFGARFTVGSDAITHSYSDWSRPKALVDARGALTEDQRSRYLNPPYTIGSAMIWPVRTAYHPTMNTARGFGPEGALIGDRMDLTLECIRRHYAGEPGSPLAGVTTNYADFFVLFGTFSAFVEFFHLQDLATPEGINFFLPFDDFQRPATPTTADEYVTYREATLRFIERRGSRMADWVQKVHPDVEVLR
ncbi:DUF6994 family protein [Arthrobacter sp. MDT2-16]